VIDAVVSAGIAVVALASATVLLALLLRRPGFRHRTVGYLICATLLSCGIAHGMSAAGFWQPLPEAVLAARIATFLAGLATAIVLLPRVPTVLASPSAADLAAANARLQAEIGRRSAVEVELRAAQSQLEAGVSERTADLVAANERLEREIRERRSVQDSLHQAIQEREALLREVHHRVKNNLQMMSSLLNLQIRNETSDMLRQKLREMQARLGALSLVHKKLYGGEDLMAIDLANLLAELCKQLGSAYRVGQRGIVLEVTADPLLTDMDHAIPLALLVTEAVTNALKHAFPDGRSGPVSVGLQQRQGREQGATALLRIADDGVGMPQPEVAEPRPGSVTGTLGLTVMRGMARQLDGDLELRFDRGVEILVTMRLDTLVAAPGLRRTA
jgi:two-component sensor histidine kinase